MTDLPMHEHALQLLRREASEVERQLAALNLTTEDIKTRCYRAVENGVSTYYFDGVPIVRSYIKIEGNTITSVVEKL